MDRIDRLILDRLEADARLSFAELGEAAGLSKSSCWTRVQALERDGVIQGYHARIDPAALGLTIQALVQVSIRFDGHRAFEAAVLRHPAVLECFTTAGDADYMLRVFAADIGALDELLRHGLAALPGVQRFSTIVLMKTIKREASVVAIAPS